tara:strand:- start:165 stop:614 length:450 start_codon:yes stop_codon:yes gene_type:complete
MIRFIEESDIKNVVALGKKLHEESPIFSGNKWNELKAIQMAERIISNDRECGILAFSEGKLVGMILGFIDTHYFSDDEFLSEYFVYVEQSKRGSKLGISLLQAWINWGRINGIEETWMQYSTNINLEKTDKFFQKIGFNKIGYIYKRGT